MTRTGISIWGSRVLEVKGRQSGVPRHTPVNLLDFEGRQYLVAPRGEAQWVRNARADGGRLALILGRRRDPRIATELPAARSPRSSVPIFADGRRKSVFLGGVSADPATKTSCGSRPIIRCSSSRIRPADMLSGPRWLSEVFIVVAVVNTLQVRVFDRRTSASPSESSAIRSAG